MIQPTQTKILGLTRAQLEETLQIRTCRCDLLQRENEELRAEVNRLTNKRVIKIEEKTK